MQHKGQMGLVTRPMLSPNFVSKQVDEGWAVMLYHTEWPWAKAQVLLLSYFYYRNVYSCVVAVTPLMLTCTSCLATLYIPTFLKQTLNPYLRLEALWFHTHYSNSSSRCHVCRHFWWSASSIMCRREAIMFQNLSIVLFYTSQKHVEFML